MKFQKKKTFRPTKRKQGFVCEQVPAELEVPESGSGIFLCGQLANPALSSVVLRL